MAVQAAQPQSMLQGSSMDFANRTNAGIIRSQFFF